MMTVLPRYRIAPGFPFYVTLSAAKGLSQSAARCFAALRVTMLCLDSESQKYQ